MKTENKTKAETVSQKIWEEIKDKSINVFSMDQRVNQYFEFLDIDPIKCYLRCKASAALPALETTLGKKFACTLTDKQYILVEEVKDAV